MVRESEPDEPQHPVHAPEPAADVAQPPPSSDQPPDVVPLGGARIPADHGLAGLGLIMQLAGTLFSAFTGVVGLITVITILQANAVVGRFGGTADNSTTLWLLVLAVTGVARSMAHRAAGTRLLYDGNDAPFSGIRRYVIIAAIQTVVWTVFFAVKGHAPTKLVVTIAFMLAAWPATLALIISLPRYKRLDQALPMAEDKGFEGASILMLIFGLIGLGFALVLLYVVLQLPSSALSQLPGIIVLLVLTMLVVRSVLHIIAGWRGVHENHMDRTAEAAGRYGVFGVITAFVAASGMMLLMMAGRADVSGVLAIGLVGWLLLAWPLIIRKFFSERQFADLLASGDAPLHRRAPDLGLSTLGWLLLGLGAMALSSALPQAVFGDALTVGGNLTRRSIGDPMSMMFSMMHHGARSPWWAVGLAALQIWAGIELIRMTDFHRVVATIYGVVATAVAIYVSLPVIEALEHGASGAMINPLGGAGPIMYAMLAIGLIVPVATLILSIARPRTAQARYRSGSGPR
jgi:hypothetical protein